MGLLLIHKSIASFVSVNVMGANGLSERGSVDNYSQISTKDKSLVWHIKNKPQFMNYIG